jgi:hypothetical protein
VSYSDFIRHTYERNMLVAFYRLIEWKFVFVELWKEIDVVLDSIWFEIFHVLSKYVLNYYEELNCQNFFLKLKFIFLRFFWFLVFEKLKYYSFKFIFLKIDSHFETTLKKHFKTINTTTINLNKRADRKEFWGNLLILKPWKYFLNV